MSPSAPVPLKYFAEPLPVTDTASDVDLQIDVAALERHELLERAIEAAPFVAHRIRVHGTEDNRILLRLVHTRRLQDAAVQRKVIDAALERDIAGARPTHSRKTRPAVSA